MLERIKNLVVGRPNGLRRRIVSMFLSEGEDTSPNASFSSPMGQPATTESSVYTPSSTEPPKGVTPPEGFEVVLHKDGLEEGQEREWPAKTFATHCPRCLTINRR